MWQADDGQHDATARPEPWSDVERRLDRQLVGAYCAMRFDRHSRERVMRDLGLASDEIELAVRRGAEIYGHDVEDALRWVGVPAADAELRRRARRQAFRPENRLASAELRGARLSAFFPAERQLDR